MRRKLSRVDGDVDAPILQQPGGREPDGARAQHRRLSRRVPAGQVHGVCRRAPRQRDAAAAVAVVVDAPRGGPGARPRRETRWAGRAEGPRPGARRPMAGNVTGRNRIIRGQSSRCGTGRRDRAGRDQPADLGVVLDQRARILAVDRLAELRLQHHRVHHRLRREVVVRVEIRLLHQRLRGAGDVAELAQLLRRVQVVVAVLGRRRGATSSPRSARAGACSRSS